MDKLYVGRITLLARDDGLTGHYDNHLLSLTGAKALPIFLKVFLTHFPERKRTYAFE